MMISNIPITAIVMISLLLPGVIAESGPDGGLGTQSLDIKLKWHATGSCNGQGGPERDYSNGACLDIPGTTRGVEILDRKAGCYIVSYDDGNCKRGGRKLDTLGCKTLRGKNSVGFKCD